MDINQTRVKALKAVMAGASQKDFANQHGLDASYLSQILNGHRNLGEKAAANLEDKIGLPKGSLVSPPAPEEQAPITPAASATEQLKLALAKVKGLSDEARNRLLAVADEPQKSNVLAADLLRPGQVGDEVWIAHYDVRAAMGGGQIPHEYPEMLQDIRVSPKHLRDLGVTFKEHFHLKMITGWGQSMEGTINDKDLVIVDRGIKEFVGEGIYVVTWHQDLYIKRIMRLDEDNYRLISDNQHYENQTARIDDVTIHAKVLLIWNARKA